MNRFDVARMVAFKRCLSTVREVSKEYETYPVCITFDLMVMLCKHYIPQDELNRFISAYKGETI